MNSVNQMHSCVALWHVVAQKNECLFVLSFRNTAHRRAQRGSRERGRRPLQPICFKSTSTSCGAKCASSCWTHRPASRTSADRRSHQASLPASELVCDKRRDSTLLDLRKERRRTRSLRSKRGNTRGKKERTVPAGLSDGREMIAPWKVDVRHGHGDAHTDQNEACGKHRSHRWSTGTLLHFVCGCSSVCVCVCVNAARFDMYAVRACVYV